MSQALGVHDDGDEYTINFVLYKAMQKKTISKLLRVKREVKCGSWICF